MLQCCCCQFYFKGNIQNFKFQSFASVMFGGRVIKLFSKGNAMVVFSVLSLLLRRSEFESR